jgi:N-dimethylarginine dimethylaminohydrolase
MLNPWMEPSNWARDKRAHFTAMREWCFLYDTLLQLGTRVELVAPAAGLPDLVFTANAGVVLDRQVLLARFRHPERQREEPHYRRAA